MTRRLAQRCGTLVGKTPGADSATVTAADVQVAAPARPRARRRRRQRGHQGTDGVSATSFARVSD